MKRATNDWPNGFYFLDEVDIERRDSIVRSLTAAYKTHLLRVNKAIQLVRVETPCLTPASLLKPHIDASFELIPATDMYLRPESTAGTYEAFRQMYPISSQRAARLPICVWQVSRSFRNEGKPTWEKLRFREFEQIEYQLFYGIGTKVDYHAEAVKFVVGWLKENGLEPLVTTAEETPHYSEVTTDVYLGEHETVAVSTRKDFECPVLEMSVGLTRLMEKLRR